MSAKPQYLYIVVLQTSVYIEYRNICQYQNTIAYIK